MFNKNLHYQNLFIVCNYFGKLCLNLIANKPKTKIYEIADIIKNNIVLNIIIFFIFFKIYF